MSRSSRSRSFRTRDVVTPIATPVRSVFRLSPLSLSLRPLAPLRRLSPLRPYEDRRTYHPLGALRPARSFSGPTRLKITPSRKGRHLAYPNPGISFRAPRRVLVCVRRHVRREVIHALGKAGRGGQRHPRRTIWSDVHC